MAHGFSGTCDDGLPATPRHSQAGFAVVLFDYRYFGASSGEPRQLLDIADQQEDYRAACGMGAPGRGHRPGPHRALGPAVQRGMCSWWQRAIRASPR